MIRVVTVARSWSERVVRWKKNCAYTHIPLCRIGFGDAKRAFVAVSRKMEPAELMQSIMVVSEVDGRKFKMVMRGDLRRLSVEKIKRYLEKSTQIPLNRQVLSMDGVVLGDANAGGAIRFDAKLHSEAVRRSANRQCPDVHPL